MAAVLAGALIGGFVGTAGAQPASADGQATGRSGIAYRIETVCATGEMQLSSSDVKPGQSATMSVRRGLAGEVLGRWDLGDAAYASANLTADQSLAMDPQGLSVYENDERVISATYGDQCTTATARYGLAPSSAFMPVTPTRILDTRPTTPVNYAGPKPVAGASIAIVVTGGPAAVPAGASAVVLNVTAVDATAPGYVQAFPTGRSGPGASSNLNVERAGQTIPNAVVVPVGQGGRVTLFTEAGTHLIADITGYFVPVKGPVAAGRYLPVTPKRVLDTRPAVRLGATGQKPAAGARLRFAVSVPGAPATSLIAAVAVNMTATEASGPGFVQVAAGGRLVAGATSSLNVERSGQTIANLVIVPVSADGTVEVFTERGTHLLADVVGYFTTDKAPLSSSGLFVPVLPERILDTRGSRLGARDYEPLAGGSVFKDFGGIARWNPAAVMLNLTATNTTEGGYVQAGAGGAMVHGAHSNLNMAAGQTIPNAVIAPIGGYPDALEIYNDGASDLLADLSGWFTA